MKRVAWLENLAIVVLFALFTLLPPAGWIFLDAPAVLENEQRKRAKPPKMKWTTRALKKVPADFEHYYRDWFGFRGELLRLHALSQFHLLRTSPTPTVAMGWGNWLFYVPDGNTAEFRNVEPLSAAELATWQASLENRRRWLAERGIEYILLIIPEKQAVYPELVPPRLRAASAETRGDQLAAHLAAHSDFRLIYLREPLVQAKGEGELYLHSDTHWNHRGAFVGYDAIARELDRRFPGIEPHARSEFVTRVSKRPRSGDLARLIGMEEQFSDTRVVLRLREKGKLQQEPFEMDGLSKNAGDQTFFVIRNDRTQSRLRGVIVRDSFGGLMVPWLAEHFAQLTSIWRQPAEKEFDRVVGDYLDTHRPDVFIEEFVERFLDRTAETGLVFGRRVDWRQARTPGRAESRAMGEESLRRDANPE